MESVRYEAPNNVEAAVRLLAGESGAKVLSGGTDLIVQMRLMNRVPTVFVDVKRIPRLSALALDAKGLRAGAAVPAATLYSNETIRKSWPGLAEATDLIGSSQIQGRATWAGNLCNASPAADSVPALIACGATAVIAGPKGERRIPVEQVNVGPGKTSLARAIARECEVIENQLRRNDVSFPQAVMVTPNAPRWWDSEVRAWLKTRTPRRGGR